MIQENLVKIILGIVVVIAVVLGISLLFGNQVIDFFKGLTGIAEQPGQIGNTSAEKTYKINSIGFKINNITSFNEVIKTGEVELIVLTEANCEKTEYQIWQDKFFDAAITNKISLNQTNIILNQLNSAGKYHVDGFCFDKQEKATKTVSKNLVIK